MAWEAGGFEVHVLWEGVVGAPEGYSDPVLSAGPMTFGEPVMAGFTAMSDALRSHRCRGAPRPG